MAIFGNLGNGQGGGDFLPLAIYDARAGRLFKVERSLQGGQWTSERVDITNEQPSFVFDFGSIEAGWLAFSPQGPHWVGAPYGKLQPERPSDDHKLACKVKIYSQKYLGGVREFSATAKCVLSAIDALHDIFEAAPEAATGKVPVVKLTGSTAVVTKGTMGTSTNYAPKFVIEQWVDRPEALGSRTVPPPGGAKAVPLAPAKPAPAHPAAPAGHVPPPGKTQIEPQEQLPF
jgi:hypothetical protein